MTTKEQNMHKEYLPNSYVLIHYRTGLPPTRLHTNWKGPMRVIKESNSRYILLDLLTGKEKDYHVSDMKPFVFDSASSDQMKFFIEKISHHRGKLSQWKSLQFFVSWMGYDQTYDSWEPYANLRDSTHLHSNLREKNLTQLIPITLLNAIKHPLRNFFHFYYHWWSVIGFRKFLVSRSLTSLN